MFSGYMWHGKYFSASCTNKNKLFTFFSWKKKKERKGAGNRVLHVLMHNYVNLNKQNAQK